MLLKTGDALSNRRRPVCRPGREDPGRQPVFGQGKKRRVFWFPGGLRDGYVPVMEERRPRAGTGDAAR